MAQTMTKPDMQACIDECASCHNICVETVAYCLEQGGRHAAPAHIRLLLDCADICRTSADFMLRGSELHGYTCGICAAICERCAQDCEWFGDDEMMRRCADACRSCAESCRRMASMAGQPHAA
jgi:hypothetical protein